MFPSFRRHPLAAALGAAFILGLAACGGNGSDDAASTSPGNIQPRALKAADDASPSTAAATDDETPPVDGAFYGKEPDTGEFMDAPISGGYIRGDVLATAIVQGGTALRELAGPDPVASLVPGKLGQPSSNSDLPNVLYEENLAPAEAGSALGPHTFESRSWIEDIQKMVPIDAVRVRFGLSQGYPLPPLPAGAAQDAEVLRVGTHLEGQRQIMDLLGKKAYGEPDIQIATAKQARIFRRSAKFRKGGELMDWEGNRSLYVGMNLILRPAGSLPNTDPVRGFRLCLEVRGWGRFKHADGAEGDHLAVDRTSCGHWEVPQGWQPGQPLKFLGEDLDDTRERLRYDSEGNPYDFVGYTQYWGSVLGG